MSTDEPKRTESAELTIAIPRESLPPTSTVAGMTVDMLADIKRAQRDLEDDRETQMECPWCRVGLVSATQRDAWLAKYPELEPPPPSQPEEPPPSRPEAA